MERYKLIPFDISKAKTPQNPKGLEVVTTNGTAVTIVSTDFRSSQQYFDGGSLYPILAVVHGKDCDMSALYGCDGEIGDEYCGGYLYLKEPILNIKKIKETDVEFGGYEFIIKRFTTDDEWNLCSELEKILHTKYKYDCSFQDFYYIGYVVITVLTRNDSPIEVRDRIVNELNKLIDNGKE